MRSLPAFLARLHDRVTAAGFGLGMLCLVVIVVAYLWEVVARYLFQAPTWWSSEVVSYALCIGCFLVMPQVTRKQGHVAVSLLVDVLAEPTARRLRAAIAVASLAVCALAGWICLSETLRQIEKDVYLLKVQPIPKAWISAWMSYGFFSSALYFLRLALAPAEAAAAPRTGEI